MQKSPVYLVDYYDVLNSYRYDFLRLNEFCVGLAGMGQRALELMGDRALKRKAFGRRIAEHGAFATEYAKRLLDIFPSIALVKPE